MGLVYHFEWDAAKARTNNAKHRVTFQLATTVFRDQWAITIFDEKHSRDENRWITLGMAANGQYLTVIHTVQETTQTDLLIRIISAREADTQEIQDYKEAPR